MLAFNRLRLAHLLLLPLLIAGCSDSGGTQHQASVSSTEATAALTETAQTEGSVDSGTEQTAEPSDAPEIGTRRTLDPEELVDLSDVNASRAPEAGGQLTFTKLGHDFGPVDDTRPLEFGYEFTNTGEAPIEIVTIKASCGCMTTELSKKIFAPGEGDVIDLAWEPKGRGRQTKTIDVVVNAGGQSKMTLRASADVTQVVSITPLGAKFGDVPMGQPATLRLFANSIDPEMTILGINVSNRYVTATYAPGAAMGLPDQAWVIDLIVAPNAPKGRLHAKLEIRLEAFSKQYSVKNRYKMEHNISGTVVGKLKADPFAFLVGLVPPNGEVNYGIVLSRMDGEPFQITSSKLMRPKFEGLELFVEELPGRNGSAYRLRLSGPVGSFIGILSGMSVEITTNVPEDASMVFPIMGRVGKAKK